MGMRNYNACDSGEAAETEMHVSRLYLAYFHNRMYNNSNTVYTADDLEGEE